MLNRKIIDDEPCDVEEDDPLSLLRKITGRKEDRKRKGMSKKFHGPKWGKAKIHLMKTFLDAAPIANLCVKYLNSAFFDSSWSHGKASERTLGSVDRISNDS